MTNANTTANTKKERRNSNKFRRRNTSNSPSPAKSNTSSGDPNKLPVDTSIFSTTMANTSINN